MSELKLIIPMVVLHLVALVGFAALLALVLRQDDTAGPRGGDWRGDDDGPPPPPPRPTLGPPLRDATPARVRLRGPGLLADAQPRRSRRRHRPPLRPPTHPPEVAP